MIYFLIDNNSLSVYNHSTNKQSFTLADKVKFNTPLSKILNKSKKLNSVIARSLDKISEKVALTNNRVSIVVDDSLLSHSIVIKSKKYKTINDQLKKEAFLKWGDAVENLYFISEEKKSPKNVYHSIAIHHFLREKIKLNFNNFGMNIAYLVPLSSVLTAGLKTSQFATIKNGKKFTFFTNSKKGFMFFKANFSGENKSFEKIIGLLDIPKIKLKDLDKNSLRFIFFNRLKIVEYLDNFISKDVPLLNFVESSRAQIIGGKNNSIKKTYNPSNDGFDYTNLIKNVSSFIISILFLTFVILFFSDYKFLDTSEQLSVQNTKELKKILSPREVELNTSLKVINKLEFVLSGNTKFNNFIVTYDIFEVNNQEVDFDNNISAIHSNISTSFNDLLIKLFEIDSNCKFKVFNTILENKDVKNLVLRFENKDSVLDVVDEIKNFNNVFLRKASFINDETSFHLYLTIIEP